MKSTDFGTQKPREVRKDWFNQHRSHFEAINLFTYLVQDLRNEINPFLNDLKSGISDLIEILKKHCGVPNLSDIGIGRWCV